MDFQSLLYIIKEGNTKNKSNCRKKIKVDNQGEIKSYFPQVETFAQNLTKSSPIINENLESFYDSIQINDGYQFTL